MDPAVLCTHCQVEMTSWSAPGSPIRYFQCPFCARTQASCYGEVFTRGAGARLVSGAARPAAPGGLPRASADDIRWAAVKARAAHWFARLEAADLGQAHPGPPPASLRAAPASAPAPALAARPARHR
jgi:hypothetical protein